MITACIVALRRRRRIIILLLLFDTLEKPSSLVKMSIFDNLNIIVCDSQNS